MKLNYRRASNLAVVLGALALHCTAHAEGSARLGAVLPQYQQECGACHLAFPPAFLPKASWNRIMDNLPKHFGTDASLDAATRKELSAWMLAHAGTYKRASEEPPQDRISHATWFVREHREVAAAAWKLAAVKSAANCGACHTTADQGDFHERNIRIPR
ncbi:MAG: diheme cytochrome c [Burkholderiales bacterium]|nr:diheme cytochrome c [Burkholderiales bacterium]